MRIKDKGISITAKFLFINTFILSLFLSILDISPDLKIAFVFKNFIQICSILSLVLIFLINLLDKDNQNKNNVRNYFKTIFSTSVIIIGLANLVIQLQKFPISRILSFSFPIIPIIILISTVLLFVIYKQHLKKKPPIRISGNLILILILILGAFLRLYRLGQNSIRDDELYVNSVAYNFINEGDFYKWDWILEVSGKETDCIDTDPFCNYTRAWPYTLLVAASYKILGVSELTTRLPGAILGIISIGILYNITNYFLDDKRYSLLTTFLFVLSPYMISWSRYARMYSLLIPLFLLTIYFLYRGMEEENMFTFKNNLLKIITKKLNYNYKNLLLGLIFLFLSYQVHVVSLIIIPLILLYIIMRYFLTRDPRYLSLILLGLIISILSIIIFKSLLLNIINSKISIGDIGSRTLYASFLFEYPIGILLSLLLLSFLLLRSFLKTDDQSSKKGLFLITISLGSLVLYLKYIDTALFIDSRYISFLIPVCLMTISFSIKKVLEFIKNKSFSIFLILLIIFSSLLSFFYFSREYFSPNGVPNLDVALSTIKENYKEGELIITNSVRTYYLRGIKSADIVQMSWRRSYPFADFKKKICEYDSGWVYWEADKVSFHIKPEIYHFVEKKFLKYHGGSIDDTGVDVYYFKKIDLDCN